MKDIRWIVSVACSVVLLASCGGLPQSTRTDENTTSIREEYLKTHPDGKYNTYIQEGRIVKGMGVLDVLASWGLPNLRRPGEKTEEEFWAYHAKDELSQQVVSYELDFVNKVLTRWSVRTDLAGGLGTTTVGPPVERTVEETLRLGPTGGLGSDTTPDKKTK